MDRLRAIATLAIALLALALPAAASASPGSDRVIQDCADDGDFERQYPRGDLEDAKKNLPSDIVEYTGCKDLIDKALATGERGSSDGPGGAAGGGGAGGAPGTTTPAGAQGGSAADVAALRTDTQTAQRGKPSIQAGGQTVSPASSGLNDVAGSANALPASLILAIALLAGLCAVGGAVAARRRWPDLVRAPLRLIRR